MLINNSAAVPVLYTSPAQVNIQIPWELDPSSASSLTASVGWLSSAPETLNLAAAAPVIFLAQPGLSNQGLVLIASTNQLAMQPSDDIPNARPVHPGEYISILATGLGAVTHPPATG